MCHMFANYFNFLLFKTFYNDKFDAAKCDGRSDIFTKCTFLLCLFACGNDVGNPICLFRL